MASSKVDGLIQKINPGDGTNYSIASTAYGYCETSASDSNKIVEIEGFQLLEGTTIHIKFKYQNTAINPTLKVNSNGEAKPIKRFRRDEDTNTSEIFWASNSILSFTYDGSAWVINQSFTNDPLRKDSTFSDNVLEYVNKGILYSPTSKYLWHDLLAFDRLGFIYRTSEDNTTWTEITDATTLASIKNLFNQKGLNSVSIFSSSSQISGVQFIWNAGDISWSVGRWLVIGINHTNSIATYTIKLESSSNGSSWTTKHLSTDNQEALVKFLFVNDYASDSYLRLTITKEPGSTGSLNLNSIKLLSPRLGSQGGGPEYEYPYDWDNNKTLITKFIRPDSDNTKDLGTSSYKWRNIYTSSIQAGNLTIGASGTAENSKKISSNSTLFLNSAENCSLIFQSNNTEVARFDQGQIYSFRPSTDNGRSLGTSSYRWNNLYINTIRFGGPSYSPNNYITSSESGNIYFNINGDTSLVVEKTDIRPGTGKTVDLGTSSIKWNNVYANNFKGNADSATAVTQNASNLNNTNYRILLSGTATDNAETTSLNKASGLIYNPSTYKLTVGNIDVNGNLNVIGSVVLNGETTIESETVGDMLVNGGATFVQSPVAPTPSSNDNSTKVATTEFVKNSVAGLSGAMHFIGTTTTSLTDGATTNPISISGSSYTAVAGDVVLWDDSEFVWIGTRWERLGRDTSFKVQQSAVPNPSASGSTTAFIDSISQDANGVITVTKKNLDTSGNWSGSATKLANTSAIGNTTLPVYFNSSGQPVAITGITKAILGNNDNNTLAYTRNGVLYAGNHYVGDSKISINSTSAGQGALYVNGSTSTNGMIIPTVDNSYNLGTRNGRWKDFYASYINVHPENRGTVLPFFINDLAFLTDRGGSYSMSKFTGTFNTSTFESVEVDNITDITNKGASDNTLFNCFNGRYNYTILSDNNQNGYYVQKTDTIIIDITCPQVYKHGSKIYIDFGNLAWCAQDIYFYTRKNDPSTNTFTLQGFIESNTEAHWFQEIYESSGINEIRIVLKNWKSDIQRISQIGLISFQSENLNNIVMSRGEDDPIYRSITPNATNTYNLGKSTYSWNNLYIKSIYFGNNSILSNLTNNIYFNINENVTALVIENGDIRPGQNQTIDLGTSSQKWNNLYVKDFFTKEATESGTTYRTLMIGNETNRTGRISLYSGSKGGYIQQAATNNWVLHQLPVESGWIVKAGNGTSTGAGDKETPIYVDTRGVAKPVNALPVNQNLLMKTQYYFDNSFGTKPIKTISAQDIPMADCHSKYCVASGVGTTDLSLGTFAPEPDTWYTLSFYAKTNYNNTSIRTHFYPDTTATSYNCQGFSSTAGDGVSIFTASTKWQRYWVCYKTSASVSGTKNLIARLISGISPGTTLRVALPKLEVGQVMTPWVPHAQDFSQNKISTCYVDNHDVNNYQWHRIATCSVGTANYSDRDIILFVHKGYLANAFGILKISVRMESNAASPPIKVQAKWLLRHGFSESDCFIGLTRTSIDASSAATADIYFKTSTTYARIIFTALNNFNKGFTLLNSDENSKTENDVKVTDLANSTEVYIKEDIMNGDTIESIKLKGDASSNTGTTYVSWAYASDSSSEKSLIPNANVAYDLGSSSLKWANVYANNYYGNWVGETIPVNKGGTGQTSLTANKVLIGNGTNAIKTTSLEVDNEGNLSNTKTNQTDLSYNITNNRGSIGLRVAENRGLFDYTQNKWIIYKPSTSTGTDNVGQTLIPSWANKGSTSIPVYFNNMGEPVGITSFTTNYVLVGNGTNGIKASSKLQIPVNDTGMITAVLPMNLSGGGTNISATDNSTGNLIIGSRTSDHLALDTNEIQGRNYSNGTCTANPICLNYRGGEVWLGLDGAIRTGIVALYPKDDLSLTLGKNAARWSNIYTKGNINIGLAGDEATIQYDSTNKTLNFIFN